MNFSDTSVAVSVLMVLTVLNQLFFMAMKKGTRRCLGVAGFAAQAANGYATFVAPRARAMVPSAWVSSAGSFSSSTSVR
jgi:hypothetical protein